MNRIYRRAHPCFTRCSILLLLVYGSVSGLITSRVSAPRVLAAGISGQPGPSPQRCKVSEDLRQRASAPSAAREQADVIVQFRDKPSGVAEAVLGSCGAKVNGDFRNLNTRVLQMPASA